MNIYFPFQTSGHGAEHQQQDGVLDGGASRVVVSTRVVTPNSWQDTQQQHTATNRRNVNHTITLVMALMRTQQHIKPLNTPPLLAHRECKSHNYLSLGLSEDLAYQLECKSYNLLP